MIISFVYLFLSYSMINSMTAKRMADFDAFDGDGSPGFGFNDVSPRASGDERRMRSSPSASASPSWRMTMEALPEWEALSPTSGAVVDTRAA